MTLSYRSGPSQDPLLGVPIGHHLARVTASQPEAPALVSRHQNLRQTYAELSRSVETVALGLLRAGIARGDRVALWSPTCAEWLHTQLATARVGAILVTINPAYRSAELAYALHQCGARMLVTARSFKSSDYLARIAEVRGQLTELEHVVVLEEPSWQELIRPGGDPEELLAREATLDADDPINIQYTSGTTGFPKGATLTHHNILNNAYQLGKVLGYTSADRVCVPVPLYHCFGMGIANLGCLSNGATLVYPAASFDPLACLEAVSEERCTSLYGVPTMFIAQLEHPEFGRFDLTSLRTGIMAGAPCPIETMKRVMTEMHARDLCIAYGMTETSPASTFTRPHDSPERRSGSVGTVLPHVEVKVADPQSGLPTPCGVAGEICTRGYLVMRGYWNDPAATARAIDPAGWMHTGDLGVLDEQGYLRVVGRIKDMICRGGENIYPREIEELLYGHPEVVEAQVIGVPDARMGEELCAWIRLREGAALSEEGLRDYCRGLLSHFKVPRYVKFTQDFPMTVTGKVQKFRMRELSIEELGLQAAAAIETA